MFFAHSRFNWALQNSVDQAAEFLPSHGEGIPQTARHSRTPQELHKLSRTVNSAWRSVKFRSMHFNALLARVNAFSVVPESEKEQIRSMNMSHVLAVDMAARQLNLFGAFVAQVNLGMGAGDPQDGSAPFSLRTAAPEAWALLEATMAAIAHPPQQLPVLLTNKIATAYASAGDPSIRWFGADHALKVAHPRPLAPTRGLAPNSPGEGATHSRPVSVRKWATSRQAGSFREWSKIPRTSGRARRCTLRASESPQAASPQTVDRRRQDRRRQDRRRQDRRRLARSRRVRRAY